MQKPQHFTWRLTLLLAYALLNATLYSGLLPLWEGFDEPFHYGYVQHIWTQSPLPILGNTSLSLEVWRSLQLAPTSHVVRRNLPMLRTYDEYFALRDEERARLRYELENIPPSFKYIATGTQGNYEAHQAPLAYLLLAIPDWLLSRVSISLRVVCLRILCGAAAAALIFLGALKLTKELGLQEPYCSAAVWCAFSCQMFWATVARVCNDWLAVSLSVWFFASAITLVRRPSSKNTYTLMFVLALGLLTKAYFLAFVIPAIILTTVLVVRKRVSTACFAASTLLFLSICGWWYARNQYLYHSLSGMVESVSGVGPIQVVRSVFTVPWYRTVVDTARASLWTGNNSFLSFSKSTITLMLILLIISLFLYAIRTARIGLVAGEGIVVLGCCVFLVALAYVTVVSYIHLKGEAITPSPWYIQVLLVPTLSLSFVGIQRSNRAGAVLGTVTIVLWGYVLGATYIVKLVPLYGGYERPRAHLREIYHWYIERGHTRLRMTRMISLAPPELLAILVVLILLVSLVLQVCLVRDFVKRLFPSSLRSLDHSETAVAPAKI